MVMSGFFPDWLVLREPYDRTARNGAVLDAVAAAFADAATVAVTDLGCGTGATLRAVAPRLPCRQRWLLVDNDAALLANAVEATADAAPAGSCVETAATDLAASLTSDLTDTSSGGIERVLGDCDLVTASALLDLVSAAWLDRLVELLARLSRPFYAALSYDGVVSLSPKSRYDSEVIAAVNRHQRTDKGFGPALGPDAARTAPERSRAAGFTVIEGRSDWRFGADDRTIQMETLSGWAGAAREIGADPAIVAAWLAERRGYLAAGRSQMRVGHVDFFATPRRHAC